MTRARRFSRAPDGHDDSQSGRQFDCQPGEGPAPGEVVLPEALAQVADQSPSSLLDVIGAAVHPLEIAASLETCGLSNAVVHERFGHKDVFSLAGHLYDVVRFRAAPVADRRKQRPSVAVGLAAASVGGTAVAALWPIPAHWWREVPVRWGDFPTAMNYVANGCCCGSFVALFMVLEPAKSGLLSWPGAAAYPMVLSLGVMEWQLRSLRARIRHASHDSFSLGHFVKMVRRKLARSTLSYLAVLAALTVPVQALAAARGAALPISLLAAASCLAFAFFLALVVASCGRVDLVLRAWLVGLGVYGALAISTLLVRTNWAFHDDRLAFCAAVSVAATVLVLAARRVVLDPVSHR